MVSLFICNDSFCISPFGCSSRYVRFLSNVLSWVILLLLSNTPFILLSSFCSSICFALYLVSSIFFSARSSSCYNILIRLCSFCTSLSASLRFFLAWFREASSRDTSLNLWDNGCEFTLWYRRLRSGDSF